MALRNANARIWALTAVAVVAGGAGISWGAQAAGATGLPDSRAYELVSPPAKNGGDILPDSSRVRAAASETPGDPMAATFGSLSGFGDVRGGGVATEYMSVRSQNAEPGTNGWLTHAITPLQKPLSYFAVLRGQDPAYDGDLSPDLSVGIFRAWSLLSPAPNVERIENLYRRTDLRTSGAGSYELLSDAVTPVGSDTVPLLNLIGFPALAGASADFGHVLFESRQPLTMDAFGFGPKLYEWDHGILRLAGILPDGTPAPRSSAGQGALNGIQARHTISSDGRRIFFLVQEGTCSGSSPCGELYARTDHAQTSLLNASERTDCAADPTCGGDGVPTPAPDPAGAQWATYWDASTDGTRVIFTTAEALTDDAVENGDTKLYMYDTGKPASDPHNLTLLSIPQQSVTTNDVQGVIGASSDGRAVYFITTSQLVAGGPDLGGNRGIFLWQDVGASGANLAFVGELANSDDIGENLPGVFGVNPLRARLTPDGSHLVFSSTSGIGLTDYDHGTCSGNSSGQCREIYVYSAASRHLACASCNPSGAPATADAVVSIRSRGAGAAATSAHLNHAISDDGTRVFFSTGEALVPEDANGRIDAYEYDTLTQRVSLISDGKSTSESYFMDMSSDGHDVFFTTRAPLVGWDTDGSVDLYDARMHGGFPEPAPPSAECAGDACHGHLGAVPADALPGSLSIQGSGNVKTPAKPKVKQRRCKRGTVRKIRKGKVVCAQRKKRKPTKTRRPSRQRRMK